MTNRLFYISCLYILLNLLPFESNGQSDTIITKAGTGIAGYTGDGGMAIAATIYHPIQVVTDALGNVYFAELDNSVVRKVDTSGFISTVAGTGFAGYSGDGGSATSAQLNSPYGVAVDNAGNIYIADAFNQRIRKVSTSGIITTIAGTGTSGYFGDGGLATSAELWNPTNIRLDNSGNLYICDNGNNRVRKIDTSGIISLVAGNGISGYNGDGGLAISAELDPSGVMADNSGNVYIADEEHNVIRKVNSSGIISTIAGIGTAGYGGDAGPATAATLNGPEDIFVDNSGNIYFNDAGNNRVRKINASGIITTIAGTGVAGYSGDGGLATLAELNGPDGVYKDNVGNIYIAEAFNNRIREIKAQHHPPHFTAGHEQSATVCENSVDSLNSLLAIIDTEIGYTDAWSIAVPPTHGTAIVTYSTISTGGLLTPVGLYYTPDAGFTGSDIFMVSVSNGAGTDETQIAVLVDPLPNAGIISGLDSICPGAKDTMSETVSDGIWSYSNVGISTISFSGVVTGISAGHDTIIYTVINSCGIASAIFPFEVKADCPNGINTLSNPDAAGVRVFPNPAFDGEFAISLVASTKEDVQFTITDVVGQKLKRFTNRANNPVDIKLNAPPGIYFLSAVTKDGKWSEKIVISSR